MINLYKKYCEIINYLIFGVLTTLVSILSYYLLSLIFDIENNFFFILINILSWFCAVTFAYLTNKKYVFKSYNKKTLEFIKFILSRIITLLIEIFGMYLFVKVFIFDDLVSKIIMQIVIIILNYLLSKLIVFKK